MLPFPTPISRIQLHSLELIGAQKQNSLRSVPVVSNRPDKIIYTDEQIDKLSKISFEFLDGSINMEKAILKLRAGGRFKDISFLAFYLWLYSSQNNSVQGFQQIRPPHQEWMPKGANQRPPYVGGYGSSNSKSSLGLGDRNNEFKELSGTKIRKAYSQIPSLYVEETNESITAWSVAKHAHHGPAFGLDLAKYGLNQSDLDSIAEKGLINHIRDGGTPLNTQYIQDFQKRWKIFAEDKTVTRLENQIVMGQECVVLKHKESRLFVSFNASTGESYTGYKLTPSQSRRHDQTGVIGKNYQIK